MITIHIWQFIAIALIQILLITLLIIMFVKLYNARYKLAHSDDPIPVTNTIRALLIKDTVELEGGIEVSYRYDKSFVPPNEVYIEYFKHYEPMIVLMFEFNTGFVLTFKERDAVPKYYPIDQVYLGKPKEVFVNGYTSGAEDEIDFYITSIVEPEVAKKETMIGEILPHI